MRKRLFYLLKLILLGYLFVINGLLAWGRVFEIANLNVFFQYAIYIGPVFIVITGIYFILNIVIPNFKNETNKKNVESARISYMLRLVLMLIIFLYLLLLTGVWFIGNTEPLLMTISFIAYNVLSLISVVYYFIKIIYPYPWFRQPK